MLDLFHLLYVFLKLYVYVWNVIILYLFKNFYLQIDGPICLAIIVILLWKRFYNDVIVL